MEGEITAVMRVIICMRTRTNTVTKLVVGVVCASVVAAWEIAMKAYVFATVLAAVPSATAEILSDLAVVYISFVATTTREIIVVALAVAVPHPVVWVLLCHAQM